jgi:hypothetical protein
MRTLQREKFNKNFSVQMKPLKTVKSLNSSSYTSKSICKFSIYVSFFKANVFKEITNETTTIELLICFIYTQKSNYLHNNIFLVIEITKGNYKKKKTTQNNKKNSIAKPVNR